jgi:acyl-coenzyme A thioesterase 9
MLAHFIFVARHIDTHKSHPITPVVPGDELEQGWYDVAANAQELRKVKRTDGVNIVGPTPEEQQHLHKLWGVEEGQRRNQLESKDDSSIQISLTKLQSTKLMHPQLRNIHGNIFGGYLMRESFELAWTTASLYGACPPTFLSSDEVTFLSAVPVGCVLQFSSRVIFSSENSIQVEVKAEVLDPITGTRTTTNVFHYSFNAKQHKGGQLLPRTYSECMGMIAGRRIYEGFKAKDLLRASGGLKGFTPTTGLASVATISPVQHALGHALWFQSEMQVWSKL